MKVFEELLPASDYKIVNKLANLLALLILLHLSNSVFAQSLSASLVDEPISSKHQIMEAMAGLEYEHGPYDLRFVEVLDDRGHQLQESGDHINAIAFFKQALHISRVNEGLYHESQFDMLDSIIDCAVALKNWEAVNNHYAYMEHLYRRLYTVKDVRLELGLQKVVAWHVNALKVNLDGKRLEHLLKANTLFKLRLRVAELTLTADDPKLDFLYRNIAIVERQLYLSSSINKEVQRRQQNIRRHALLADLD